MDSKTYVERLTNAVVAKDEAALTGLIEDLTVEIKAEAAQARELVVKMAEERTRAMIDARLASSGLGELATEIVVLGPTGFELVVEGDWTPTLGELMIIGRAFNTSAIEIEFDLDGTRKRSCDCGDPDCFSTDRDVPRLVIAVEGADLR